MKINKSNIVLIGMPGSGKSTIGILLAKKMSFDFIDTDVAIQVFNNRSLQQIINEDGYRKLIELEEEVLLGLKAEKKVIATGGSAVYSDIAMSKLKANGIAVFLETELKVLKTRVKNFETRGIAKAPDQSFEELFEERSVLYKKYADITIVNDGNNMEIVCSNILNELEFKY